MFLVSLSNFRFPVITVVLLFKHVHETGGKDNTRTLRRRSMFDRQTEQENGNKLLCPEKEMNTLVVAKVTSTSRSFNLSVVFDRLRFISESSKYAMMYRKV